MSRFHVVRDPGVNVGYRNLGERALERQGDSYTVNGAPLRFFHFSGFDPARPYALSRAIRPGSGLPDEPGSGRAVRGVRRRAPGRGLRAGSRRAVDVRQARRRDAAHRQRCDACMARASAKGRSGSHRSPRRARPSSSRGRQGPADRGSAHGLTRLALAVYEARPDLQTAFPDLDGAGRAAVLLVDLAPSAGRRRPRTAARLAPGPAARKRGGATRRVRAPPWGVNVAGYLRSELGVGEAARAVISGLDARGVPLMPVHGGVRSQQPAGPRLRLPRSGRGAVSGQSDLRQRRPATGVPRRCRASVSPRAGTRSASGGGR